jgi:arabinose-5-phosphate isomerase
MIHDLVSKQRLFLASYFEELDCSKAEEILKMLAACKGTVIFSGVGKSGHIAQKIAATFLSTGTKAFFLDPMHAVHGDLGYVAENDLFLAFSKSGESQELVELIPSISRRGALTIGIVSNGSSKLARICDRFIVLPVKQELCPFDLSPTTSTTVQLLFGDCLAIALMNTKKVSLSDLALNHPGGFIGRRITLKVADLMIKGDSLPLCDPSDSLLSVLPELSSKRCGCLLVVDRDRVMKGIFTDGDLRRSLERFGSDALQASIGDLMTKAPRATYSDQLAWEALQRMEENSAITVLPVLEGDGRVAGLLRMHDIIQAGLSVGDRSQNPKDS